MAGDLGGDWQLLPRVVGSVRTYPRRSTSFDKGRNIGGDLMQFAQHTRHTSISKPLVPAASQRVIIICSTPSVRPAATNAWQDRITCPQTFFSPFHSGRLRPPARPGAKPGMETTGDGITVVTASLNTKSPVWDTVSCFASIPIFGTCTRAKGNLNRLRPNPEVSGHHLLCRACTRGFRLLGCEPIRYDAVHAAA